MADMPTAAVLITRPQPEADIFAALCREQGIESIISPVMAVRDIKSLSAGLDAYDSVIVTSARAVSSFPVLQIPLDMDVFCVGEHSADAVRALGYRAVYSAQGDVGDLLKLVHRHQPKAPLYLRGEDIAFDLCGDLNMQGLKAQEIIVYALDSVESLSPAAFDFLRNRHAASVCFFSKRTVRIFFDLAMKAGLEDSLRGIKALCISEGVVKCVQAYGVTHTYCALSPDRQGMLALLSSVMTKNERVDNECNE